MADRLKYGKIAPEGLTAMRAVEHYLNTGTSLPQVLLDLVRLRASLRNGCAFCEQAHTAELRKHHEPETRIDAIAMWQQKSEAFTPRELAALAWVDLLTHLPEDGVSDAAYAAVGQYFEGKDLVDLTMAISMINAWNRLGVAFQPGWHPGRTK